MTFKKALLAATLTASTLLMSGCDDDSDNPSVSTQSVRFATYNISFDRPSFQALVDEMQTPAEDQAAAGLVQPQNIAETLQRTRPDVVVLNEFNNDGTGENNDAIHGFQRNYLAVSQNGAEPIEYDYVYNFATNTGLQIEGMDLDKDGIANGGPDDALGYGAYHGQYAFAVFSKYPLDVNNLRTFQNFKWKDRVLESGKQRENPVILDAASCESAASDTAKAYCLSNIGHPWYTQEEWDNLPLSSKIHADLPVILPGDKTVHFLVSHPAPPIFDNPVKHNSLRNADEVAFWNDYVSGNTADSEYIVDDANNSGGLSPSASFVIAGDLNADAGDSGAAQIQTLLKHERVNGEGVLDHSPTSEGALEYYHLGLDERNPQYPERMTSVSHLQIDFVLPSSDLSIKGTEVFWPAEADPYHYLVKDPDCTNPDSKDCYGKPVSSDHRLVWADIIL